jgi:phospholipid/cholesterol/gamma-HCH transport system ATP-binding protein
MAQGTPLIEFRDVVKRFDGRAVLDGINLKIYEGHITTIIGKSGTGKSVLLKHVIGLLSPDEGTILFRGISVSSMKKGEWDSYRTHVSYLFQHNALFDSMTVFDNVALPLRQTTKLSKKEIEGKVMARLDQTELSEAAMKYPSELSGGMQKRVALARALVTDPAIVLFDEPTTGQDPIRRNAILSMIAQYKKRFGFTAVLISHDIPDVFFISDRIVLLWEGKVAFQGTYEEMTGFSHPLIDEFLQSLHGFQDELTGLLSKQMFRARYDVAAGQGFMERSVTAVLFSVEFDLLAEHLGPRAAAEVMKAVGECVNNDLAAPGGFSSRQGSGQILTILPHTTLEEARQLVSDFGRRLEAQNLPQIQSLAKATMDIGACFEIYVSAVIIEARSNEDLGRIVQDARSKQEVIARYLCGSGGRA